MKIGNKLKIIRHIKEISQLEFAKACKLAQSDISKIEADGKKFVPTSLLEYLVSINVNLNWLFDEKNEDGPIFLEDNRSDHINVRTHDLLQLQAIQETLAVTSTMNSNALVDYIKKLERLQKNSKPKKE